MVLNFACKHWALRPTDASRPPHIVGAIVTIIGVVVCFGFLYTNGILRCVMYALELVIPFVIGIFQVTRAWKSFWCF